MRRRNIGSSSTASTRPGGHRRVAPSAAPAPGRRISPAAAAAELARQPLAAATVRSATRSRDGGQPEAKAEQHGANMACYLACRSWCCARYPLPLDQPEELTGPWLLRSLQDLHGGTLLDNSTAVHEDDPVRDLPREADLVRDDD